jgi:hypothetical protein
MPRDAASCHIGVVFYTHRGFPTQWALVLSENSQFEGHVWCSNVAETMNGWCLVNAARLVSSCWQCLRPPVALFSDVDHVGRISAPKDRMQAWIARRNFASELDRFQVHAFDDITSPSPSGVSARDRLLISASWI